MDGEGSNVPGGNSNLRSTIIGVVIGLVFIVLIFGALNYFRILPISELFPGAFSWLPKQATKGVRQQPTATSSSDTKNALFSNIPFAPSDPFVTNTTVLYTIKGKVNKFEIKTNAGKNVYMIELWSLDGRTKYNFEVPEDRIVERGKTKTGAKVAEGDDVQMVVSVDLKNPATLNYGSVYILHDTSAQ